MKIKQYLKKTTINILLYMLGAKSTPIRDLWNKHSEKRIDMYVNNKLKFVKECRTAYKVLTPTGFKQIHKVYKTVPYEIYEVTCENGMVLKCADKHLLFNVDKDIFLFVDQLYKGEIIQTLYGYSQIVSIRRTKQVEHMYDIEIDDYFEQRYYTNGILSHNTTTIGAYLLWFAAFRDEEDPVTVLVVSNKSDNAKEVIERIKTMYEGMPMWLKPGVTDDGYNKHSLKFDNGSRIISQATSENSGRGLSISLLFCHHKSNTVEILDDDGNIRNITMEELAELLK